jgi:hypothetical protein
MILADHRLSPRARRAFARLAPAVCPPDVVELDLVEALVDQVELTLRAFPPLPRRALAAGAIVMDLVSRLFREDPGRAFARIGRLPGPGHTLAKGIKAALVMAYYEHPRVRARLGYDQASWIAEVGKRRLERFGEQIRRHDAGLLQIRPLVRKVMDGAA